MNGKKTIDKNNPGVILVRLPGFKAVSTGYHAVAEEDNLWALWSWMDQHKKLLPFGELKLQGGLDFVLTKNGKVSMICAIKDTVTDAELAPYEMVELKGGLYATAISHEGYSDSLLNNEDVIMKWLEGSNFIYDHEREIMGENINDDEEIFQGLGCYQFLKYVPVKLRT